MILFLLLDMLESFFYNIAHVIVREGVVNVFAGTAVGDEVALTEDLELMRNGGFGHSEERCYIADAHRIAVYGKQNADSR